ncbi:MAG: enoyl-CoA hydratase-related protein [Myxococcota bacterium]
MGIEALASALGTMRVALEEGVLTLTLDRPDRLNAFTTRMGEEWLEVLDAIDADDAVRAVIVTGAGRAFCAGADLAAGGATFDPGAGGEGASGAGQRVGTRNAAGAGDPGRRLAARRGTGARHAAALRMPQAADRGGERGGRRCGRDEHPADGRCGSRARPRASASSSRAGASSPRPAAAGSCRAWWASRRRCNGWRRGGSRRAGRRLPADSSPRCSRPMRCCRARERSRGRSPSTPAACPSRSHGR